MRHIFTHCGNKLGGRKHLYSVVKPADKISKVIRANRPGVNVNYGIAVDGMNISRTRIDNFCLIPEPLISYLSWIT